MIDQMKVDLLHSTPLHIASKAIRKCWSSEAKSDTYVSAKCIDCGEEHEENYDVLLGCNRCANGTNEDGDFIPWFYGYEKCGPEDLALIDRVANKFKHASTIEHISFNFDVYGLPRNVLQEVARHRTAKLSVKSSRYTLRELKSLEPFLGENGKLRAKKFIYMTGDYDVDNAAVKSLEGLRGLVQSGKSNDITKFAMPENFLCSMVWTMDLRNLKSFLKLRRDKSALWAIRDFATLILKAIPHEYRYLIEGTTEYEEYNKSVDNNKYIIENQGDEVAIGFINTDGDIEYDLYHHADGGIIEGSSDDVFHEMIQELSMTGGDTYKVKG